MLILISPPPPSPTLPPKNGFNLMHLISLAGDSRAILCRNGQAIELTRDHTAMDKKERKRLEKCHASIAWIKDSWRVGKAGIQVGNCVIAQPALNLVVKAKKQLHARSLPLFLDDLSCHVGVTVFGRCRFEVMWCNC